MTTRPSTEGGEGVISSSGDEVSAIATPTVSIHFGNFMGILADIIQDIRDNDIKGVFVKVPVLFDSAQQAVGAVMELIRLGVETAFNFFTAMVNGEKKLVGEFTTSGDRHGVSMDTRTEAEFKDSNRKGIGHTHPDADADGPSEIDLARGQKEYLVNSAGQISQYDQNGVTVEAPLASREMYRELKSLVDNGQNSLDFDPEIEKGIIEGGPVFSDGGSFGTTQPGEGTFGVRPPDGEGAFGTGTTTDPADGSQPPVNSNPVVDPVVDPNVPVNPGQPDPEPPTQPITRPIPLMIYDLDGVAVRERSSGRYEAPVVSDYRGIYEGRFSGRGEIVYAPFENNPEMIQRAIEIAHALGLTRQDILAIYMAGENHPVVYTRREIPQEQPWPQDPANPVNPPVQPNDPVWPASISNAEGRLIRVVGSEGTATVSADIQLGRGTDAYLVFGSSLNQPEGRIRMTPPEDPSSHRFSVPLFASHDVMNMHAWIEIREGNNLVFGPQEVSFVAAPVLLGGGNGDPEGEPAGNPPVVAIRTPIATNWCPANADCIRFPGEPFVTAQVDLANSGASVRVALLGGRGEVLGTIPMQLDPATGLFTTGPSGNLNGAMGLEVQVFLTDANGNVRVLGADRVGFRPVQPGQQPDPNNPGNPPVEPVGGVDPAWRFERVMQSLIDSVTSGTAIVNQSVNGSWLATFNELPQNHQIHLLADPNMSMQFLQILNNADSLSDRSREEIGRILHDFQRRLLLEPQNLGITEPAPVPFQAIDPEPVRVQPVPEPGRNPVQAGQRIFRGEEPAAPVNRQLLREPIVNGRELANELSGARIEDPLEAPAEPLFPVIAAPGAAPVAPVVNIPNPAAPESVVSNGPGRDLREAIRGGNLNEAMDLIAGIMDPRELELIWRELQMQGLLNDPILQVAISNQFERLQVQAQENAAAHAVANQNQGVEQPVVMPQEVGAEGPAVPNQAGGAEPGAGVPVEAAAAPAGNP